MVDLKFLPYITLVQALKGKSTQVLTWKKCKLVLHPVVGPWPLDLQSSMITNQPQTHNLLFNSSHKNKIITPQTIHDEYILSLFSRISIEYKYSDHFSITRNAVEDTY